MWSSKPDENALTAQAWPARPPQRANTLSHSRPTGYRAACGTQYFSPLMLDLNGDGQKSFGSLAKPCNRLRIKRVNHLYPTTCKVPHIARCQNQLVFLRCSRDQHVRAGARDALGLKLPAQHA